MADEFYLADGVHVCVTEGHCVFLDLKQDKYSAVLFSQDERDALTEADAENVRRLVRDRLKQDSEALLGAGLLTRDASAGRPIEPSAVAGAQAHIFGLDDQRAFGLTGEAARDLNITMKETCDFFWASWKASYALKHTHIAQVVASVRRRKEAHRGKIDVEKLRRLTAVYRRLRPWYPRKYLCLYDSLALVEFLACAKVFPVWVFAVQAQPFGAHCWVQSQELLLNEGSEYAGQFTPIMAV